MTSSRWGITNLSQEEHVTANIVITLSLVIFLSTVLLPGVTDLWRFLKDAEWHHRRCHNHVRMAHNWAVGKRKGIRFRVPDCLVIRARRVLVAEIVLVGVEGESVAVGTRERAEDLVRIFGAIAVAVQRRRGRGAKVFYKRDVFKIPDSVVITGWSDLCIPWTSITTSQLASFPAASLATYCTRVMPRGNVPNPLDLWITGDFRSLSWKMGSSHSMSSAEVAPGSAKKGGGDRQKSTVGGWMSDKRARLKKSF